jgi:hypothetical protein
LLLIPLCVSAEDPFLEFSAQGGRGGAKLEITVPRDEVLVYVSDLIQDGLFDELGNRRSGADPWCIGSTDAEGRRSLAEQLESIGVANWDSDYEHPHPDAVLDGYQWKLVLSMEYELIVITGDSRTPGGWAGFMTALAEFTAQAGCDISQSSWVPPNRP